MFVHLPLLGLDSSRLNLLLLEPAAHLLQLDEGAGSWVGGHGGILDERVRRLHVVPQLGAGARVNRPRSLRRAETGSLVARGSLGPTGAPKI